MYCGWDGKEIIITDFAFFFTGAMIMWGILFLFRYYDLHKEEIDKIRKKKGFK